jgi:histidyl-tRNA synthetase
MVKSNLQTQPYKGSRDFYPEDFQVRDYIFSKWRKICKSFGYEEYDGPFLEPFEVYAAKSGEELVNEQLYSFTDRGNRKVAIRAEMTPTISRMVAQKYGELLRPIRWFSIPNLWRYEKPQKGRLREHYQLNVDIFGTSAITSDFEIMSVFVTILKEFGAKNNMFEIRLGNRRFLEDVYAELGIEQEQRLRVSKALDKKNKLSPEDFDQLLRDDPKLSDQQLKKFHEFLANPTLLLTKLKNTTGADEVNKLLELCANSGLDKVVHYDPAIIRGLDYYTGNVFELFDLTPQNTRAMAGGGRYDNLVEAFIDEKITGIGFGMGDVTFKNFLENWGLLPAFTSSTDYLITLWPSDDLKFQNITSEVASALRANGKNVLTWLDTNTKLDKQLKFADKKNINYVVIIGDDELRKGTVTIKNLQEKTQETKPLHIFLAELE